MSFFFLLIASAALVARGNEVSSAMPQTLAERPELGDMPAAYAMVHYNFYSADVSAMLVSYFTPSASVTWVDFGTAPNALGTRVMGSSAQWHKGNGFTHTAVLSGLQHATTYYFRCGNDTVVHSFRTRAANQQRIVVGVVGDMGIENSANTIARFTQRATGGAFDFALHIGDVSYADDHFLWFQKTWFAWFAMMNETLAAVPYMTLPGNHEHGTLDPFIYADAHNFQVYNHYFNMPKPAAELRNGSMFYSFNYGPVHFVQISTETSYPNAPWDVADFGDQMSWLVADLTAANTPAARKAQPWIVVSGHRPIYSSSEGYSKNGIPIDSPLPFVPCNSLTLQKTFEKIFNTFEVDLVLAGHVHSYERLYPTLRNQPVQTDYTSPSAPVYVVVGNAGSIEGLTDTSSKGWTLPQPAWSAVRIGVFGYGVLEVNGAHTLKWSMFNATDDGLLDTFTISK